MRISEMTESERPREKLLSRGPQALADGELLAILLRTGSRSMGVLELARHLLNLTDGSLTGLFDCDAGYLASLPGVGAPKAATLLAAFELGRRFMLEQGSPDGPVTGPHQIYALMLPRLKGIGHEECWVVLLDRKSRPGKISRLTVGGGRGTIIDIPAIIRMGLSHGAAGIVLVHNHPGGDPSPSSVDIRETAALRDACASCGIALLDHIIVADQHFYSFNEEKMF